MRRHHAIPDVPRGYPLSPCRGMWSVIVSAAATNLITNPSFELATTGYTASDADIARTADWQRRGVYGLSMTPMHNASAVFYSITLAPNTTYTWSVDEQAAPGIPYRMAVYDVTASAYLSNVLDYAGTGTWNRRRLSFITSAGSSYRLELGQHGGSITPNLYTDGWQLCQLPYDTTYIDGDQPGCSWAGNRHASTSSRSAQSRRGGRVVNLQDCGIEITGEIGLGMQPAEDIVTPTGVLGGAYYQRTVQRVRTFTLVGAFLAASFAQLQRQQADLHDLLSPFAVAEQQPLALRYQAMEDGEPIGDELELLCHYVGGLEGNTDNLYREDVGIQFAQYQSQITTVGESAAALGTTESIADANHIVERQASGVWHAMGGGLDDGILTHVKTAVYGPDGNLYIGGDFLTAYNAAGGGSPVTVNNIARWDGTSWTALGGGLDNWVYSIVFDAAGNLYAGGIFLNAAYPKLAKWDGSSWAPVNLAADATGNVYALAIDAAGTLYVAGAFTNWAGDASADRIVSWDGSAWAALGTGANGDINALLADTQRNKLIAGGTFTTIGGVTATRIASWDIQSSTWVAFEPGFNNTVHALGMDASGQLFVGGDFTDSGRAFLSRRVPDATSYLWSGVGSGVNSSVRAIARLQPTTLMDFGGLFTEAGGLALADGVATWTGSEWWPVAIDLPGTLSVSAIGSHPDGRLVFGYFTAGTATASRADTDVINTGTAPAAPVFTVTGPGLLESIVNWTTGKGLYFNLLLQAGETVTIDLTPGAISVMSSYRGNVGSSVLSGSDLASWRLLPGTNTIVVKSATAPVLMRWKPTYQSLQGATR